MSLLDIRKTLADIRRELDRQKLEKQSEQEQRLREKQRLTGEKPSEPTRSRPTGETKAATTGPPKPETRAVTTGPPSKKTDEQYFMDAKGEVERELGREAQRQIESTRPAGYYLDESQRRQEQALRRYEAFFTRLMGGLYRKRGELLSEAETLKTREPTPRVREPQEQYIDAKGEVEQREGEKARRKIRETGTRVTEEGTQFEAGLTYSAAQATAATAAFLEGVTAPIRPYNIPRSLRALSQPETRQAIIQDVKQDPLKYTVGVPSAYLGGVVAGRGISYVGRKTGVIDPQMTGKFVETTETRTTSPADWAASKRLGKGEWGPPGASGYLELVQVPKQITRKVFIPKLVTPKFDVPFGVLGTTGILSQASQLKPTIPKIYPVVTPKQFLVQRQVSKQRQRQPQLPSITLLPPQQIQDIEETPIQAPRVTYYTKPRTVQRTEEKLILPPKITPVTPQIPRYEQPRPVKPPKRRKKPPKKKKTKRETALEQRLDPLAITFPDVKIDVKTPKPPDVEDII